MKIKTAPTSCNNKVSAPSVRRTMARLLGYSGVIALLWAQPSQADEVADVSKLLRTGKVAEALVKTNEFLAKHPADPQMRFMKGVLLTEQNKSDEAIAVFTKLTEDYRDLPEPYNNLAVLYAANGQYDKARVALEKAIRTNPSYMTAYENLGDVYGKMASQAYDKALALGATTAPAKSKLTLLRTFSSSTGAKVTVPETPVAQAAPAPVHPPANAPVQLITPLSPNAAKALPPQRIPALSVTPPPAVAAKPAPAPAPVLAKIEPPKPVPAPAPVLAKVEPPKPAPVAVAAPVPAKPAAPVVLAKVEPAKPAAVPAPVKVEPAKPASAPVKAEPPKPAPAPVLAKVEPAKPAAKAEPDNSDNDAVLKQVHGWAKAWSAQNVDGYLGYYANEFEPPKGMSRKAWADERRARIAGKGRIHVEITSPEVDVHGNTAKVTFRQTYESDRLTARSRKTLVLIKNGGKWQIKQESSGS